MINYYIKQFRFVCGNVISLASLKHSFHSISLRQRNKVNYRIQAAFINTSFERICGERVKQKTFVKGQAAIPKVSTPHRSPKGL